MHLLQYFSFVFIYLEMLRIIVYCKIFSLMNARIARIALGLGFRV